MVKQNAEFIRNLYVQRSVADPSPVDITGWTITQQGRLNLADLNPEQTFSDNWQITDGPGGKATLTIPASETAGYTWDRLVSDIFITPPAGSDHNVKVVRVELRLEKAVTR